MNTHSFKKGFGIIEVMVASAIIVILLISLTSAGKSTLSGFSYSNERSQATYLAQEGLEIVRQMRDSAWIDKDPATSWDSLMTIPAPRTSRDYCISFSSPNFVLTSSTPACLTPTELKINNTQFSRKATIYKYDTGLIKNRSTDTPSDLSPYARKVEVTVSWKTSGGADREVKTSEILTNWREN